MAHILVIDDDTAVVSAVRLVLERSGHDVVSAHNGPSGLQFLTAEHFDLVLVDIFMPEMDGFETIRLFRKTSPGIRIVVMSGGSKQTAAEPDYLLMATKLGAMEALRKPFRPNALIEVVNRCLERPAAGVRPNGG
jgi:CheY-like chemotaxis protein